MSTWGQRWSIEGTRGNIDTVATDENGEYGCSCPAWKFRRQECRHIKEVKIQLLEAENAQLRDVPVYTPPARQRTIKQKTINRDFGLTKTVRKFAFED